MNIPVSPIYTTSYPEFARLWHQGKWHELKSLVNKIFFTTTTLAVIGGLALFLFGEWIIRLTVTDEYLPALSVLRWLAVGTTIAVATSTLRPLLLAAGQANRLMIASALGIILQFALLLALTRTIGVDAAGIAYLGFYGIWIVICIIGIRQVWQQQTIPIGNHFL
jgi:O-antigen/teichoic acid export membrane protein